MQQYYQLLKGLSGEFAEHFEVYVTVGEASQLIAMIQSVCIKLFSKSSDSNVYPTIVIYQTDIDSPINVIKKYNQKDIIIAFIVSVLDDNGREEKNFMVVYERR